MLHKTVTGKRYSSSVEENGWYQRCIYYVFSNLLCVCTRNVYYFSNAHALLECWRFSLNVNNKTNENDMIKYYIILYLYCSIYLHYTNYKPKLKIKFVKTKKRISYNYWQWTHFYFLIYIFTTLHIVNYRKYKSYRLSVIIVIK